MAIPSSPGFNTTGPIEWDTVRSALGAVGAQNINALMAHANIEKYSFYRPGGIKIDFGNNNAIIENPDTSPHKWGDWRNYNKDGEFPYVPSALTGTYNAGATTIDIIMPIFWAYLNIKQLSSTITHVMTELWRSNAKTNLITRTTTILSWATEPVIPDHSTIQTERPIGSPQNNHILTFNPSLVESYSPLYAETWLSDLSNGQRAKFENFSTDITLNALLPAKIEGLDIAPADLPTTGPPSGSTWATTGNLIAIDVASTPVCAAAGDEQANGTGYSFYWSIRLRDQIGNFYSVPINSIDLRIKKSDNTNDQVIGTSFNISSSTKQLETGTLTSGSFATGDIWRVYYTGSIAYGNIASSSTVCP